MDSVNLCPSLNRTMVYRMILIGLFAYLKTKGYEIIYLWSCPSKQNQDYIFYMKPPKMKMPTRERLSLWYTELFRMAKDMKIVHSFSGISEFSRSHQWKSIDDVPYLEGDMWVTRMEESVLAVKREVSKLEDEILKLRSRIQRYSNNQKKLNDWNHQLKMKQQERVEYDKNAKIWQEMCVQIRGFNSQYFIIKLSETPTSQTYQKMANINIWPWINDRHLFVDFFWGNMMEFSSERRAQYSTYVFLYRLFAESKICIQCKIVAESVSVR